MNLPTRTGLFILALSISTAYSEPGTDAAQGIMSLFNGKDLTGWTTKQPDNHDWSVVDGVIDCNPQGEGKGDRELWTTKEYADFELWVDWRIKESPFVNNKARIILPDGSYQKDDSGNMKQLRIRGSHYSLPSLSEGMARASLRLCRLRHH